MVVDYLAMSSVDFAIALGNKNLVTNNLPTGGTFPGFLPTRVKDNWSNVPSVTALRLSTDNPSLYLDKRISSLKS